MSDGNELVTKKVILLYIADRLGGLTEDEFMNTAIETIYMDYFDFSDIYQQLLADGFLYQGQRKGESNQDTKGKPTRRVDITAAGKQILASLYQTVPLPVRKHLDESTASALDKVMEDAQAEANIYPEESNRYRLRLQLLGDEGSTVFDLSLRMPTRETATRIADKWKQHYALLYPKFLNLLSENLDTDSELD